MIDLHSHVLPGVDDGATDLEASLEMLRIAAEDGTTLLVATPHQRHPAGYHVPREEGRAGLERLRAAAAEQGIAIELRLGAEIHFSSGIPEGIASGELTALCESGRYFLLELPVTSIPGTIKEVVFALQTAGRYPVLAHPERNFEVMENPEIAVDLRDRGVLLQLTAGSITGVFGRKSEKVCRKLLKRGVVDVIASDAHNPGRRPPGLSAAVETAARLVGRERAELMVDEVPRRILEGQGGLA